MAAPFTIASGSGDSAVGTSGSSKVLMGWSVKEDSAAVATLVLRHGTSTSDPIIAVINLAASASETRWLGPNGVNCPNGIFVDRLTGTTTVVIYTN